MSDWRTDILRAKLTVRRTDRPADAGDSGEASFEAAGPLYLTLDTGGHLSKDVGCFDVCYTLLPTRAVAARRGVPLEPSPHSPSARPSVRAFAQQTLSRDIERGLDCFSSRQ